MEQVAEILRLLGGTVIYRPYVYAFFACFLVYATYHLGWKRMLTFMVTTWLIAFCARSWTKARKNWNAKPQAVNRR